MIIRPRIENIIVFGDSLSERGTLSKRKLLGVIVMAKLAGLFGRSPLGRFTNGYAWTDYLAVRFANKFIINELKAKGYDQEQIADAITYLNFKEAVKREEAQKEGDEKKKRSPREKFKAIAGKFKDKFKEKFKQAIEKKHQKDPELVEAEIQRRTAAAKELASYISKTYPDVKEALSKYNLDNDRTISYGGETFFRSYCEGGLTAYDYSWWPSTSLTRFFSRLILSTLGAKMKQLIADDVHASQDKKNKTLFIELSGANDLFTVNKEPSMPEVERAVNARIKNVVAAMGHGYKNFILISLPDLSLTPLFQNKVISAQKKVKEIEDQLKELSDPVVKDKNKQFQDEFGKGKRGKFDESFGLAVATDPEYVLSERASLKKQLILAKEALTQAEAECKNAQDCSIKFNEQLKNRCIKLNNDNKCSVRFYEVNKLIKKVYEDPAAYQFDPAKKTVPFTETEEFKTQEQGEDFKEKRISPGHGHMYWDDVHPTTQFHQLIEEDIHRFITKHFDVKPPEAPVISEREKELISDFKLAYKKSFENDKKWFGLFRHSGIEFDHRLTLKKILHHALYEGGTRTRKVIEDELKWMNESFAINEVYDVIRLMNPETKLQARSQYVKMPPQDCA